MARTTVYNNLTSEEKIKQISDDNTSLMNDFLEYLVSVDRAESTVKQYHSDLRIFFVWNMENNKNKIFTEITKREFIKFQNYVLTELKWSPKRIRRVKSVLSSLSNYIENILDDEFEDFKPVVKKIENPVNEAVREKTVFSDEQIENLISVLIENKQYQKACGVALASMSGSRKSELLRFKVSYFDDSNLVANNALYKTPEKIKTKGRGKGKFLNKYVLYEFKKYFDLWMNQRKELGIDSEWLFVSPTADGGYEQMKVSTLDSWSDSFTRILGIDFYWHSLRHYCVSRFRKLNLPSNIIVEFVGWSKEGGESMISIYDDTEASDDFEKFFTQDGIVEGKQKGLGDIK